MKLLTLIAAAVLCASAHAAPMRYEIDPAHTYPSFEADHMGLSTWRGKFNRSEGLVLMDRAAASGSVDLIVHTDSVDFGHDQMNSVARGDSLFDVERHPYARYRGTLAGWQDGRPTRVDGELQLRGVTRPLVLEIQHFACKPHPLNKRELCGADALATLQRDAFGIDAGKAFGFDMAVTLRIQVEALAER
ncbi:polyisoprenoid-binding protein [Ideonella sp. 4Y11]|uniref:Polyisoprenoid-binding protein n=1 Tax=Ideonella aquatica TaxID=2824119 RepID=A0A941BSF4_9BURK|nr:YceI family protein [Ideonella aquatica]MBQ0961605.1 polyisoprenoid-binding protein [Ideonella aquatica]